MSRAVRNKKQVRNLLSHEGNHWDTIGLIVEKTRRKDGEDRKATDFNSVLTIRAYLYVGSERRRRGMPP